VNYYLYGAALLPLIVVMASHLYVQHYTDTPDTNFGTGNMFDNIASRYDFINRALALNMDLSWRQVLATQVVSNILEEQQGRIDDASTSSIKVLDLATGTADVALILADTFAKQQATGTKLLQKVEILGVDPSHNMLAMGKTKVATRHYKDTQQPISIQLEEGDSRLLSKYDFTSKAHSNEFDAVTMSFGIRNVPTEDRPKVLCEMHRLLKKQNKKKKKNKNNVNVAGAGAGTLAIMEFSEPEGNTVLEMVAKLFIRHVVPTVGALLSGAPRSYLHLQNSIDHFPSSDEFVQLLESLKCDGSKTAGGSFQVSQVHQLNFGSVQIYVATPI
jgi:demethylmenaquinone methyltransferase/2-methoxy-6-polyprenyl-1,4-benzoquinol methylase